MSTTKIMSAPARPLPRELDRAKERRGLGLGLGVLLLGNRVRDDARAGLHTPQAALDHRRPDRDREVAVAGGVEVADGAAVDPAPAALQRIDQLHRPDLGRPRERARRKTGGESIRRAGSIAETPADLGDQVLDVGELLDAGEADDLDGPDLADAPEVVARQVHEHDVLGALLGVRAQARRERLVLRRCAAAGRRPGDRPRLDLRPRQRTSISGEEPSTVASRVSRKKRYGDGLSARSARYTSNGSTPSRAVQRWEMTAW